MVDDRSTSAGSRSRAGLVPLQDIGLSLNKLREARLSYALGFSSTTWRTTTATKTTALERTGGTKKPSRRHIALSLAGWLAGCLVGWLAGRLAVVAATSEVLLR